MARGYACCGDVLTPARVVLLVLALFATHHLSAQWTYVNSYGSPVGQGEGADRHHELQSELEGLRAENAALHQQVAQLTKTVSEQLAKTVPEQLPKTVPDGFLTKVQSQKVQEGHGALAALAERCNGLDFEPGDEASRVLMMQAEWHVSTHGQSGPRGFGGVALARGAMLRVRLLGRGVARVQIQVLQAADAAAAEVVSMRLNGVAMVHLPGDESCNMGVAYRPGDVLEFVASGAAGSTGAVASLEKLELLFHDCGDGSAGVASRQCNNFERVRLPWTDCDDGLDSLSKRRLTRWVEGRLSRLVNETHAVVQVPMPAGPSFAKRAAASVFDPKSILTSYQDEGTCGPRGDDARADLKECKHGADLMKFADFDDYKAVATVNGCNFFSYKVYACRRHGGQGPSRVVLPATMLARFDDEEEAANFEADDDAAAVERCPSFLQVGRRIAIILLGDLMFQAKYRLQIASLQCFTSQHEYEFKILQGSEFDICRQYHDYFFKKHCVVAEWLHTQPENLVAAIIDADVVAATLDRGLEQWANHPADVQFYQRCLLPEIMAGNYMVRNTPFARDFLRKWASYNFEKPKGYSSSDNGAIHLVIQEYVQARGFPECKMLYKGLDKPVTDLTDYFNFVKCVLDALGPPRDWRTKGGMVTVWPRFNFWASDGVYMNKAASKEVGPVIHHGIKNPRDVTDHYYTDVSQCRLNDEAVLRPASVLGRERVQVSREYKDYFYQGGMDCKGTALRQCPERCLGTFSCYPLRDDEEPRQPRTCTDCG